jgi:hypothetical protein
MYGLSTKILRANRPNIPDQIEHIQVIRNNNSNSGYSNHILNTGYAY